MQYPLKVKVDRSTPAIRGIIPTGMMIKGCNNGQGSSRTKAITKAIIIRLGSGLSNIGEEKFRKKLILIFKKKTVCICSLQWKFKSTEYLIFFLLKNKENPINLSQIYSTYQINIMLKANDIEVLDKTNNNFPQFTANLPFCVVSLFREPPPKEWIYSKINHFPPIYGNNLGY